MAAILAVLALGVMHAPFAILFGTVAFFCGLRIQKHSNAGKIGMVFGALALLGTIVWVVVELLHR